MRKIRVDSFQKWLRKEKAEIDNLRIEFDEKNQVKVTLKYGIEAGDHLAYIP